MEDLEKLFVNHPQQHLLQAGQKEDLCTALVSMLYFEYPPRHDVNLNVAATNVSSSLSSYSSSVPGAPILHISKHMKQSAVCIDPLSIVSIYIYIYIDHIDHMSLLLYPCMYSITISVSIFVSSTVWETIRKPPCHDRLTRMKIMKVVYVCLAVCIGVYGPSVVYVCV
jgi:hypothetical protein